MDRDNRVHSAGQLSGTLCLVDPPSPKLLQLRPQGPPIEAVGFALARLLLLKRGFQGFRIASHCVFQQGSQPGHAFAGGWKTARHLDQQLRRSQLEHPKPHLRGRRTPLVLEVMRFHQSAKHRPVLIALCFFGSYQVGKRQHVDQETVRQGNRRAATPQCAKCSDASHPRHHIDAHACQVRVKTAEMNGVPSLQVPHLKGRDCDHLRLQFGQ